MSDLYAQVFEPRPIAELPAERTVSRIDDAARKMPAWSPTTPTRVAAPALPQSIAETGLTVGQIGELILKLIYIRGPQLGKSCSEEVCLPFQVIEPVLRFLTDERCLEVSTGDLMGRVSYRFSLTEMGRVRSREAFEKCGYVGPAPVALTQYQQVVCRQSVHSVSCDVSSLKQAFESIVLRPGLLEELGPAVCGGRSIFLYGPPGNGKTVIAHGISKFLNRNGGDMFVPYAVQTDGAIITIFDPTIHQPLAGQETLEAITTTENAAASAAAAHRGPSETHGGDRRWKLVRRPVVVAGGELDLKMLDLRFVEGSGFYQAPIHIKANGGVFLLDDFGRQLVSPKDLLNRWIVPLEERVDYLTLATGEKFAIPFEQLTIFSTNLDPRDLVDDAFLRRIRHKIAIPSPDRELFRRIFQMHCHSKGWIAPPDASDHLYTDYYDRGRVARSSDARDLLDMAESICRFRQQAMVLTPDLLAEAASRTFSGLS